MDESTTTSSATKPGDIYLLLGPPAALEGTWKPIGSVLVPQVMSDSHATLIIYSPIVSSFVEFPVCEY